jgi:DNA-binding MarR family transcriptional regulator
MPSVDELMAAWRREFPDLDTRVLKPLLQAGELAAIVEAFREQVLEPFEIGIGEYELLCVLRRGGSPYRSSPGALAAALRCSSGGVTKRLKKLEAGGCISRSADPEDGRGSLVSLSQRGLDLQERIFKTFLAASESRIGGIEAGRLDEIVGALRGLAEALEA